MTELTSIQALLGQKLADNYTLLRCLGDGGIGTVFLARNEALNCDVAVKVIKTSWLVDQKHIKRLAAEANALATLSHPNIVKVLSVNFNDSARAFIVLEYIEGKTLRDYIDANGPLDAVKFKSTFLQAAEALEHAHSKGIVHRDLKPENLMLTDSGTLKILDFGIAKMLGAEELRLTRTGEILGSPLYISPEQCSGGTVDGRTDIYSLGCCMYFALTGKPPFSGDTILEVLFKQLNDAPTLSSLPDLPLSRVALQCMEKDPEQRFQSAADLQQALTDGSPIAPYSRKRKTAQAATSGKMTGLKPLMIAALVLSICGVGLALTTRPNAPPAARHLDNMTLNELLGQVRSDIGANKVTDTTEKMAELASSKFSKGAELTMDVELWATRTYEQRGKLREATTHSLRYGEAGKSIGKYWSDSSMNHLNRLLMQRRYDEAISFIQDDIKFFEQRQNQSAVRILQFALADLYRDTKRQVEEAAIRAEMMKAPDVGVADQAALNTAERGAFLGFDSGASTASHYLKSAHSKNYPALRIQALSILGLHEMNRTNKDLKKAVAWFDQAIEEYKRTSANEVTAAERKNCLESFELARQYRAKAIAAMK